MSYLKYGSQYLKSDGSFIGGIAQQVIYPLNFDGSTYIQFDSVPAFPNNTIFDVTFGMYLDNNSGYNYDTLFYICNTTGPASTKNILAAYLVGDKIRFWGGTTGSNSDVEVDISSFSGQNINTTVSIDTSQVGNFCIIDDVKFNGASQSFTSTGEGFSFYNTFRVGMVPDFTLSLLKNVTIWDLKIANTNWWKGYPGDQNSAWEDQIASINGTLTGVPPGSLVNITTRPITL